MTAMRQVENATETEARELILSQLTPGLKRIIFTEEKNCEYMKPQVRVSGLDGFSLAEVKVAIEKITHAEAKKVESETENQFCLTFKTKEDAIQACLANGKRCRGSSGVLKVWLVSMELGIQKLFTLITKYLDTSRETEENEKFTTSKQRKIKEVE